MPIPPRRPGTLGGGAGCPGILFEGWCWKGGVLSLHALATYRAGLEFKHLGRALAQTGSARDFPVLFRIYAHAAQRPSPRSQTVAFPEDAHFWVREVRWLPDGRVCLGLEQAPRGEELLEDFDRPFEAWLATLHGQLPAPSARMRQLAQLPFARWATGAVPGDPPISGILYDFEEAIRFAAGFTDQSPILVEKVLAARERYLEMAGIAIPDYSATERALLQKERRKHQDLLPATPGTIDDRETTYLVRITGLPRAQVLRAVQGEMAYEDHLGLITWDSAEERAADLGLPSAGPPEAWEAVFGGDPQAHAAHLREVLARGRRLGSYPSFLDGSTRIQTLWQASGTCSGTIGIVGRRRDHAAILAAYPISIADPLVPIRIREVTLLDQGLSALVSAETGSGASLRGLLPAPFASIVAIQPGAELWVYLSIWASQVEHLDGNPPPVVEADDFTFRGRLHSLSEVTAWDRPMLLLDIDGDPAIHVFAGRESVPGLQLGDSIQGAGQIILWPATEEIQARTTAVRAMV